MDVEVTSHREEVLAALRQQTEAALEAMGIQATSHATQNVTAAGRVDTGGLRNSISHQVQDKVCYVGTNIKHAKYHEFGTGAFAEGPGGGRKGWWVYVPGSSGSPARSGRSYSFAQAKQIVAILRRKGLDAHMTQGIKAIHFLRNAVADHKDEYNAIARQYLRGS